MLQIKNLNVRYKQDGESIQALQAINLTIKQGEVIVLIGPSGCGKSTLLNVLGGIISKYEGQVTLDGKVIDYHKDAIGYVPQGYGLLPWKTVYQNCILPYKVKGIKIESKQKLHIEEIMNSLGICSLKNRYPIALSGGQRQRVALARAFVSNPQIILMDEAFSALDAIMKEEAIEIFLKLWRQYQCTSVIVTHNIEEALYMGTKIVVMAHTPGRVIKVVENPLFGQSDFRENDQFKRLYQELKETIREGGKDES